MEEEIRRLRIQLRDIEERLEQLKHGLIAQRSWHQKILACLLRPFTFVRREYGLVSFLSAFAVAIYCALYYHVNPFQDIAGAAHAEAIARTYTTIGDRMMAAGEWESARAAFDEALKLDPRNEQASYHAHIVRLLTISEPAVVGRALAQLAAETDNDAMILFAQGVVCLRRRQYHESAELFRRSIGRDSSLIGSRINLGVVALRCGDRATYYEQTVAVYRFDSTFDIAINNMAYACELRHDYSEATRLYLRMDTISSNAGTLWRVGTSMLHHDPAGAERFLAECVAILQRELPDSAAELGGIWCIANIPVDTLTAICDADLVNVTSRPEKLACALVSYGICDAMAGNLAGARAKLDRAYTLISRNGALRQVIALQLESATVPAQHAIMFREWLQSVLHKWRGMT